jgi:hypothetical protein
MGKVSIDYSVQIGTMTLEMINRGWNSGAWLLYELTISAENDSEVEKLFIRWIKSKSTLDLFELVKHKKQEFMYAHRRSKEPMPWDNAVSAIDTAICRTMGDSNG